MKRTFAGAAVLAGLTIAVGAGTASADDPWPDPFGKVKANDKVIVLDDPWPDPF